MNPLASRKQLLIAESELNRAQLVADMTTMKAGVRTITNRAKSYGALASSIASLVTGLVSAKRNPPARAGAKPSWLQTILKAAGLVSTLWSAFRPPGRLPEDK